MPAADLPPQHVDTVVVTRLDRVVQMELHRPARRNALSRQMLLELANALQKITGEDTAGVVVSGADGCFSAGADFSEITGTSADRDFDDHVSAAARAVRQCRVPVIGVVTGPCMGAANEIVQACDVVVAEPAAVFQVPAVRLGLLYNPEAIAALSTRLPDQTVRRLLVLAERFSATEALQAGLVATLQPKGLGVAWARERLIGSFDEAGTQARSATKALLDDLRRGSADLEKWQRIRGELLDSEVRRTRVREAKARYGA